MDTSGECRHPVKFFKRNANNCHKVDCNSPPFRLSVFFFFFELILGWRCVAFLFATYRVNSTGILVKRFETITRDSIFANTKSKETG